MWGGKQSKIGRKIVCQSYEEGGLGMDGGFTVLSCMKIGWLRRLMSEGCGLCDSDTAFKLFPDLHKLKLLGGEFAKQYTNVCQKVFTILCQNAYTTISVLLLTKGLFTSMTGLMLGLYLYTT